MICLSLTPSSFLQPNSNFNPSGDIWAFLLFTDFKFQLFIVNIWESNGLWYVNLISYNLVIVTVPVVLLFIWDFLQSYLCKQFYYLPF